MPTPPTTTHDPLTNTTYTNPPSPPTAKENLATPKAQSIDPVTILVIILTP